MRQLPIALMVLMAATGCGARSEASYSSIGSSPPSLPAQTAVAGSAVRELDVLASLTVGTVQSSSLAYDSASDGVWLWSSSNEGSDLNFVSAGGAIRTWKLGASDQDRLPAVKPAIVASEGRAYLVVNSDLFVVESDQGSLLHYDLPRPPPSAWGQSISQSKEWNPPISVAVSKNFVVVGYAASGDIAVADLANLESFSTHSMGDSLIDLSLAAFASKDAFIGGFADLERQTADVILRFDTAGVVLHSDHSDSREMHVGEDETVLVGVEGFERYGLDDVPQSVDTNGWTFNLGNSLVDGSDPSRLSVQSSEASFFVHGSPVAESVAYPPAKQCGAPSVPNGGESADICNSRPVSSLVDRTGRLWALFNPVAGQFVLRMADLA